MSGVFWDMISASDRERLEHVGRQHTVRAGETVFSEGRPDDSVAVIRSGRCRVVASSESGADLYLAVRRVGDVIGEMAALSGRVRSASVTALVPTTVLRIKGSAFRDALAERQRMTQQLLLVMVERLREADLWRADLAVAGAELRFSRLLLRMARAEGRRAEGGTELRGHTQLQLARWSGVSLSSVTRATRELEQEGILAPVSKRQRRLLIADLDALARYAAQ